jgi:2-octaprenyl-6-methoxyphenol hydroxylase
MQLTPFILLLGKGLIWGCGMRQPLQESQSLGLDLGSIAHLETYQQKRRADVLSMTAMCDGLVRLFSNDSKTLGHLRRAGLDITNALPTIKKALTKRAMGL